MGMPKRVERAGVEWDEFFESLKNLKSEIVHECATKKEAIGFRLNFYAARDVVLKNYGEDFYKEEYEHLDLVTVLVRDTKVVFMLRSKNRTSEILKELTNKLKEQ